MRVLFVCHRIPFPADKGDKIRAFHQLEALSRRFDVELACLVDDPADMVHAESLAPYCRGGVRLFPMRRLGSRLRALGAWRPGDSLSVLCFDHPSLRRFLAAAAGRNDVAFLYSGAMARHFVGPAPACALPFVLDMVDVDSEKWRSYATSSGTASSWFWRREADALLGFERRAAAASAATLFVSRAEAACFTASAPDLAPKVGWVSNGVDAAFFAPDAAAPADLGRDAFVMTGTMSYRPNAEAAERFARRILPLVRQAVPGASFHVVGAAPSREVASLSALPGVSVTGRVPDTRPYMLAAAACVAPLVIARGIQNKVLEGMAMARPVVASTQAFEGLDGAVRGVDLLVADDDAAFAAACSACARGAAGELGRRAREAVQRHFSWSSCLSRLPGLLEAAASAQAGS